MTTAATLQEKIDNLQAQLDETPADHFLRGLLYDLLLDTGNETAASELEARCWLKAKGREPAYLPSFGYWFYEGKSAHQRNIHWVPKFFCDPNLMENFESKEKCLQAFFDKWNAATEEQKHYAWNVWGEDQHDRSS